ncbi:hypothetical protein F511_17597 [Dorcoceras hygrometricum]|uniref:Uncharacterized protein n=1 Tax=Dorcoceras hygrometricum TaxID=472368 RepID=A0A2Z7CHB5_9LAMI|nr:hypothetical protein F511_17597 [Dorcoceras hygrometricum]
MRRVVKYHSSWARQQQVELFDASGNPGSTAGRGFNPAGGAPGGGYLVASVVISRCDSVFALSIKTTAFRLVGAMSFRCCVWYQLVVCVRVYAGCSAGVDVDAGQLSCSSKRMRRRFVVATGSPAADATLRFEVATGTSREKLATGSPAAGEFRAIACCWYFARASDWMTCLPAFYEIVLTQILLAEPLGSLAFKMVQVRQLENEQQVKLETSRWVALCLSKAYVFRVSVVAF